MPLLSVVVATRDDAASISHVLTGIRNATRGLDAEVIVVDDHSADGTIAAVQQVGFGRLVALPHRQGIGAAAARGIQEASGTYVAVLRGHGGHTGDAVRALLDHAASAGMDLVTAAPAAPSGPLDSRTGRTGRTGTDAPEEPGRPSSPDAHAGARGRGGAIGLLARLALPSLRRRGVDPLAGCFLVRRSLVDPDRLRPRGDHILIEVLAHGRIRHVEALPCLPAGLRRVREARESPRGAAPRLFGLALAHPENKRLVRFAVVGLIGVFVNFAVLIALTERLGWDARAAAAVSVETAILSNFVLNDRYTFPDRHAKPWAKRLLDFQLVSLLGYAANLAIMFALTQPGVAVDYRAAQGVAIGAGFVINYVGNLFWTYRKKQGALAPRAPTAASADLRAAMASMGLLQSDVVQERPWGLWVDWYRTDETVVKCMVIRPGARMSLQRHRLRREVWRVVSGHGEDQGAEPPLPLVAGRTHVVGKGALHRIANTGKVPLVIVEVQMGTCDEDDIERLSDDYARGTPPPAAPPA